MFYGYKVRFYNDLDQANHDDAGIVCADSIGNATEAIARLYGAPHIIGITITGSYDIGENVISKGEIDDLIEEVESLIEANK